MGVSGFILKEEVLNGGLKMVGEKKLVLGVIIALMFVIATYAVYAAVTGITVVSPNGGENWSGTKSITWTATCSTPASDYVDILWQISGGAWTTITSAQLCNASTYSWDTTSVSGGTNYQIKVKDTNAATNDVSDAGFTIDNTAPTVKLRNTSFNTTSTTPSITFNFTDTYGTSASCALYFDGTSVATNASVIKDTDTVLTASSAQSDGTHTAYVNCTDLAGNIGKSSTTISVGVDNTAPTVTISSPAVGSWTNDNTPAITFKFTDTASNSASCTIDINGTAYGINTGVVNNTNTNVDVNASLAEAAGYSLKVNCTDNVGGNLGSSSAQSLNIDTAAPSAVNLRSPAADNYANDNTPNLVFNFSDATSTTANCTIYMNDTIYGNNASTVNWTDTTITATTVPDALNYAWWVNCTDQAGNVKKSSVRTISIDATAPVVTISSPAANAWTNLTPNIVFWYTDSVNASLRCDVDINGTNYGSNISVVSNTNTTIVVNVSLAEVTGYSLKVNCTDSFQIGSSSARTINVDATAPTVIASSPATNNWTTDTTPDFVFTATDALSTSLSCVLNINGASYGTNSSVVSGTATTITASVLAEGTGYSWNVTCTDLAGKAAGSAARTINVDATAPTVSLSSPATNNWTTDTTPDFVFTATDNINSTLSCVLDIGGTSYGTNATVVNNTATTITAAPALDEATGYSWKINCSDQLHTTAATARTINIDNTAPTVSLSSPATNNWTTDTTPDFVFTVTDALSTSFNCVLDINGTNYGTNTSVLNNTATTITANTALAENTGYSWNVNCTDLAGKAAQGTARTINVDATAPTVSLSSPATNNWTNDPTPDFVFIVTDNVNGTTTCTLYINSTMYGTNATVVNNTATTITANASISQNTAYSWWINCSDQLQTTAATARTINIDTTAPANPSLALTDATTGNVSYSNSATVSVSISGASDNLGTVYYLLNETDSTQPAADDARWTATAPTTYAFNATTGDRIVYLWVRDNAGNINTTNVTDTINIDTTAPGDPTIALTDASDGSATYTDSTTINISITGEDADVNAWLVSESASSQPAETNSSWVATEPVQFTISSGDGLKTVYVWVKDKAGNINAVATSDTITLDTLQPDSIITYPTNASYKNSVTYIGGTASDGGAGVNYVDVRIYNGSMYWNSSSGAWGSTEAWLRASGTTTWNLTTINATWRNNTMHYIASRATDAKDTVETSYDTVNFTFDAVAPTVAVTYPNAASLYFRNQTSISITWTATDTTGLATNPIVIDYYDGSAWVSISGGTTNDGTDSWTVPNLNIATAKIRINATDLTGNIGTDESDNAFTIDSTLPATPAITTPSDQTINATTITIYLATNSSDTNFKNYSVAQSTNGLCTGWAETSSINATGFTFTLTQDANNTLCVRAVDYAGWNSTQATTWVQEDSTAPAAITNLAATDRPNDNGRTINLSWSAPSDGSGSGVASYNIYVSDSAAITDVTGMTAVNSSVTGTTFNVTTYGAGKHQLLDGESYYIAVTPVDNAANENKTVTDAGPTSPYTDLTVTMDEGWNLVSTPFIPTSTAIATVLSSVLNNMSIVWYYDASSSSWQFYDGAEGATDTLSTFEDGKGYWISMSDDGVSLTFTGKFESTGGTTPKNYSIIAGWNLIGARVYDDTIVRTDYLSIYNSGGVDVEPAARLWSFDIDNNPAYTDVNTSQTITRGFGYWLRSPATGTYEASY